MSRESNEVNKPNEEEGIAGSSLDTFAMEYTEDRRTMRWAIVFALVFHLIVLAIHLPELTSAAPTEVDKQKVYVVQQVRFRPPPPQQQQEIPKPRAKKVPIPDPTPDEPEPIRPPEEIRPEIDLPETDIIFEIPKGPPEPESNEPIRVGGDVAAPKKLHHVDPRYTEIARKARVEGVVIVEAIIDRQGNVTEVKVLKSLPMGLDQSAVEAIQKWRFEPSMLNGKPVPVRYNLTVNFTLQ
jgi:TonB family protein